MDEHERFQCDRCRQAGFLGAIVVDEPERGAAGIWSIACNEGSVFISHSGTHEVSVIDHKAMLEKFLNYPKGGVGLRPDFLCGLRERIPLEGTVLVI